MANTWICRKCGEELQTKKTLFEYLEHNFSEDLPRCPKCGKLEFYLPEMELAVVYVIRDGNGNVLSQYISQETCDWKDLWYDADYHNGELTIPKVPEEPGNYSVSVYFNNLAVTATNFTISQ